MDRRYEQTPDFNVGNFLIDVIETSATATVDILIYNVQDEEVQAVSAGSVTQGTAKTITTLLGAAINSEAYWVKIRSDKALKCRCTPSGSGTPTVNDIYVYPNVWTPIGYSGTGIPEKVYDHKTAQAIRRMLGLVIHVSTISSFNVALYGEHSQVLSLETENIITGGYYNFDTLASNYSGSISDICGAAVKGSLDFKWVFNDGNTSLSNQNHMNTTSADDWLYLGILEHMNGYNI